MFRFDKIEVTFDRSLPQNIKSGGNCECDVKNRVITS